MARVAKKPTIDIFIPDFYGIMTYLVFNSSRDSDSRFCFMEVFHITVQVDYADV